MVAPLIIAAGVTAAASVVGGLMAQASNAKSLEQQKELIAQARAEYEKIQDPEQKALFFKALKKQGTYTPEYETALRTPDSQMGNISVDPELKQAQMDALYKLSEIGKTGLTDADQVAIEKSKQDMIQAQSQRDAAIQQNFAQRGMNSQGLELVARQQAGQDLSNRMADTERNIQAEARNRALQAMMQRGSLAGSMRDQSFSEDAQKAKAQDIINQFNTQNSQGVAGRNTQTINQARAYNLGEDQRISDANIGMSNAQQQYNNSLGQQAFANQMAKANGMSGQAGNAVNVAENSRKANADMWSGLITGVNKGVATWANSKKKDEEEG